MYMWRKRAGPRWIVARIDDFARRFGSALALIERPESDRVLLQISCRTAKEAQQLIREFGGSAEKLRGDWLQHFANQAQTKPLRIGSRLIVRSRPKLREPAGACRRTLIIPAEAAFGTGHHATTAMCLRLLEQITRPLAPGWRMLDAGTGSGILALAGKVFGARGVIAIDNDPLACSTARRNARVNRARNIEFVTGDILKEKLAGEFDVITANLFSGIVIEALPIWSSHLAPGGRLILSGFVRHQELEVVRALRRHGFNPCEIRRRGKWSALLVQSRKRRRGTDVVIPSVA
jgi:ribosomal protein L11 methyltransferase